MTMMIAMAKVMAMMNEMEKSITLMMQDMWEDVKMRVPALAPTNLGGGCNIMKVEVILNDCI